MVFDTSVLVLSLDENSLPPIDPKTGEKLTNCKARVDYLIETLNSAEDQILIPTPVLSEYLIKAGPNKHEYVEKITQSKYFSIGDFNVRAAIELTLLNDDDLKKKKELDPTVTKAKIKFDRQIVSIAKVNGAEKIYTSDDTLAGCARKNGMRATMAWELAEPPSGQDDMFPGSE